ncbi:MAG: hypothetical protein FK734_09705 [Asgard group archaeon]|nr:hypothetical protein [Asgard group archaeon]
MSDKNQSLFLRTVQSFSSSFRDGFLIDFKNWLERNDWYEIAYNIIIIIFLVGFGVLVRLLLSQYFRMNFTNQPLEFIWDRVVYFDPYNVPLSGYSDFGYYYYNWVHGWFKQNWYPFTDWQITSSSNPLTMYSYPPIFLYFLISIWRPGMTNLWIALPLVVSDAACAGVVYLILKNIIKGENKGIIAFIGALVAALTPINLIYIGIYWLNPGPVTLFTLISFYFLTKRKWRQTFFWLAIATMTKQNALFFTFPLFMIMLAEKTNEKGIKQGLFESIINALYYILIILLVSIPWIFLTPLDYGVHMLFPGQYLSLKPDIKIPEITNTIQFTYSLLLLGINQTFLNIFAVGLNSMLLMVVSTSIIAIYLFWRAPMKRFDNIEFFEIITIYTMISHIFMPRGIYKFYSSYYTPIILIALISSLTFYKDNKWFTSIGLTLGIGIFLGFNLWHTFVDRAYTPLILFLLCFVIGVLTLARILFKHLTIKLKPPTLSISY